MSKMKKLFAMLLTLVMIMGMTVTAFADEEDKKPTADDKATATITGVEEGATITLYQIVDAKYNDYGLETYIRVNGLTEIDLADIYNPTHEEVEKIAKKTLTAYSDVEWVYADGAHEAQLEAGTFLVKVAGTGATIYNPMIISIGYNKDKSGSMNQLIPGSVNAGDDWELNNVTAYAKSSAVDITKKITSTDKKADNVGDVAIGDTVSFEINTTVPDYSGEYTKAVFTISDTMEDSLDLVDNSIVLDITGNDTDPEYTLTSTADKHGFLLEFNSDWILENGGAAVKVTYSAKLNKKADTNFDPNTNTVKLTYTNKPNETKEVEKETRHYTFEIDGEIWGENSEVTEEIKKTQTVIKDGETTVEPLPGAKFAIRKKGENQVIQEVETDKDGLMNFYGLDADVEYEIYETYAPAGFSINSTIYTAKITATYDEKGVLASYKVEIQDPTDPQNIVTKISEHKVNPTDVTKVIVGNVTTNIMNTNLSALPSTGGIGTTIFTIGGCAIMIAAAFFFFVSRRKDA